MLVRARVTPVRPSDGRADRVGIAGLEASPGRAARSRPGRRAVASGRGHARRATPARGGRAAEGLRVRSAIQEGDTVELRDRAGPGVSTDPELNWPTPLNAKKLSA